MTYTAEQLREWAEQIDGVSSPRPNTETIAEHYLAHAAALEENARLKAERDTSVAVTERIKVALRIRGTGSYVEWAAYCRDALEKLERAEAELAKLRQKLMRYEHAEAADILHPPQDEQARADFPGEK